MKNEPSIDIPNLGKDIVQSAAIFEESLAKYLEAEAEKIRALANNFDSAYDSATKYDLNDMNLLFKDTLDSIKSIKRSILENMVLGSSLIATESSPPIFKEDNPVIESTEPLVEEPANEINEEKEPEVDEVEVSEPKVSEAPELEIPQPETTEQETQYSEEEKTEPDSPFFIDNVGDLESALKELNIENIFTEETLKDAKEVFQQLSENLDFESFNFNDMSQVFQMFNNDDIKKS